MSQWHNAWASVVGTAHLKAQRPCQDFSLCATRCLPSGEEILVGAVSDGAGSAARAEEGAKIAATHFIQAFCQITDLATLDRDKMAAWLDSLTYKLLETARQSQSDIRDYACTLLGAIALPDATAYFQIGDGCIVTASGAEIYNWVFWPQHGEYINTTNFITQPDARDVFDFRVGPRVEQIAIFSDGIERLILNEVGRCVHAPALRPIFDWLRTADSAEGIAALQAYLASEQINSRTEDDKTLLVAVRTAPAEHVE